MAKRNVDPVAEREELDRMREESNSAALTNLPKDIQVVLKRMERKDFDMELNERQIFGTFTAAAQNVVDCGKLLLERKVNTPHGDFLRWVRETWPDSEDTAERWMKISLRLELNPHMKTFMPALARAGKTKMYELFRLEDKQILAICEGHGDGLAQSLDDVSAMSSRKFADETRKLREQVDKGSVQLKKRDEQIREKDARIKELVIGPQTDLDLFQVCQEIQQAFFVGVGRMRACVKKIKTETQRAAVVGTMQHMEKTIALLAHDIAADLDPTQYEATDGGREVLEALPDGINWFAPSVATFLTEATRKAAQGSVKGEE